MDVVQKSAPKCLFLKAIANVHIPTLEDIIKKVGKEAAVGIFKMKLFDIAVSVLEEVDFVNKLDYVGKVEEFCEAGVTQGAKNTHRGALGCDTEIREVIINDIKMENGKKVVQKRSIGNKAVLMGDFAPIRVAEPIMTCLQKFVEEMGW